MTRPALEIRITREQRALITRLIYDEAFRLGYAAIYHDTTGVANGPQDWPPLLRRLHTLALRIYDDDQGGGFGWASTSLPSSTSTAPSAKTSSSRVTRPAVRDPTTGRFVRTA